MMKRICISLLLLCLSMSSAVTQAQKTPQRPKPPRNVSTSTSEAKPPSPRPNLAKDPTLYVVGYAHLDTEWRWEYPQVINQYIRSTMEDNFRLFDKYPHYIFNFSGANRYRFMKEYFPEDYARVKKYVKEGRWSPAGSS